MKKLILVLSLIFSACSSLTIRPMPTATPTVTIAPTSASSPTPILTLNPPPQGTDQPVRYGACGVNDVTIPSLPVDLLPIRYTAENEPDRIQFDGIRTLLMDENGLFIGYAKNENPIALTFFDGVFWERCYDEHILGPSGHVNAIVKDRQGNLWIGTDGMGAYRWDGIEWKRYTKENSNLGDDRVYDIALNEDGYPVFATWSGAWTYKDGDFFTGIFIGDPAKSEHMHSLLFQNGFTWIGYIKDGVSVGLHNTYTSYDDICGKNIRDIVPSPDGNLVWIATDGDGLCVHNNIGNVTGYFDAPDRRINQIAFDRFDRMWVTTYSGTYYFENDEWSQYSDKPAYSIAFGCQGCAYDENKVFIGTITDGLLYDRVPARLMNP